MAIASPIPLPKRTVMRWRHFVRLAAIQAGVEVVAEEQMLRVTELVPQELAAWANLGLLALRRTAFDLAAQRLQKARR